MVAGSRAEVSGADCLLRSHGVGGKAESQTTFCTRACTSQHSIYQDSQSPA